MRDARSTPLRFRELLLLTVWTALVTAAIHVGSVAIRRALFGAILESSRHAVWLAPLGYLALLLPVALALAALGRVAPRLVTRDRAALVLFAIGAFGDLLLVPRVHAAALALLAIGIALTLVRRLERDPDRVLRLARRSSIALAATSALLGLGVGIRHATAEWRVELAGRPVPDDDAPNVLLIIWDTARASSLSLYGFARPTTPRLERLAREGVTFDRAYATAPWTLPSHGSMLTGRYPAELGVDLLTALDARHPTLAESFARNGYLTVGIVANHLYTAAPTGLARGFDRYEDFQLKRREALWTTSFFQVRSVLRMLWARGWPERREELLHPDLRLERHPMAERRRADDVTKEFLAWQARHRERPFFAMLNYFDAHDPYRPPPPWDTRFAARPSDRDHYDGAIAFMDHALGVLLDSLAARGVLDRTVIVVTADHGEQFGEHGKRGHGNSVYLPVLHVPLVIRHPARAPAGRRIGAPVSLRDLAATILDLSGSPDRARFPGRTLASRWTPGAAAPPSPILSELQPLRTRGLPMRSAIDSTRHLIWQPTETLELYDVLRDPDELRDLARSPEGRAWIAALRAHSVGELGAHLAEMR